MAKGTVEKLSVYMLTSLGVSYLVTATSPSDARSQVESVRGNTENLMVRLVDQTKRQVWGILNVPQISVEGAAAVEVDQTPVVENGDEERE